MSQDYKNTDDLKNRYDEVLKQCREIREASIITVNGQENTSHLRKQNYKQVKFELELLRALLEAEDDMQNLRVGSMKKSIDDLRTSLLKKKDDSL